MLDYGDFIKIFKKFLFINTIIFALGVFLLFGIYVYSYFTQALNIKSANNYYLYDMNDKLVSGNDDDWVTLKDISPYLINATIAIEDKNFYKHQGFDYLRIIKSLYINFVNGKTLQGASTITQQLAKNLFLEFDKTWSRKIKEAWLTINLETHYSKDEILEGYLNTINYGTVFGISEAAYYYFGKDCKDLTLAEASILAGIPKSPSNYSPLANLEASKKRQKLILDAMVKNKYITDDEAKKAYEEELTFTGIKKENDSITVGYYEDAVLDELKEINTIPDTYLETGGLKIYTNLDYEAQMNMEENVKKYITDENMQTSGIMINPESGKIIALIGGKNYAISEYNRATKAKRQVGSTMKSFLYYAALENGFTPSTTFKSEKTTFVFDEDNTYSPSNYNQNYPNKDISMLTAIAYSDNIYAVKSHLFLGEDVLVETAKRAGITSPLEAIPSLALGSEEITLLDMATAYTTLANEGVKVNTYFIRKVTDMNDNVLYEAKEKSEPVFNKSLVYILNELLTNTYNTELIDYNYPTCYAIASKLTHKYAIKTGSTDSDRLIFGYNKDILVTYRLGYDDNSYLPKNTSTIMQNMWADTIEGYLKDKENNWYEMPENVVGVLIDPISGKLADSTTKKQLTYYIKGTEPYLEELDLDSIIPTIKED